MQKPPRDSRQDQQPDRAIQHDSITCANCIHDSEINAPVKYLPEYLHHEPGRVIKSLWSGMRRKPFAELLRIWLQDLRRDPSRNRIRRLGQALVLAHVCGDRWRTLSVPSYLCACRAPGADQLR